MIDASPSPMPSILILTVSPDSGSRRSVFMMAGAVWPGRSSIIVFMMIISFGNFGSSNLTLQATCIIPIPIPGILNCAAPVAGKRGVPRRQSRSNPMTVKESLS